MNKQIATRQQLMNLTVIRKQQAKNKARQVFDLAAQVAH